MPIPKPTRQSILRDLIVKAKGEGAKMGTIYNLIVTAYAAFRGGMLYSELTTMVGTEFQDKRIGYEADFLPGSEPQWVWVEVVRPYDSHQCGDWLILSRDNANDRIAENRVREIA